MIICGITNVLCLFIHCPVMDLKVHEKRWDLVEGQFVEITMTADGGGQGFLSIKIVKDYQTIKELVIPNNTDPGRIILLHAKTSKFYFSFHFSFCKCQISPVTNVYIDCQHLRWHSRKLFLYLGYFENQL